MGGDFSYEDLGGGSLLEKYRFSLRGTERFQGAECWVLEGSPTKPDSVYARMVLFVDSTAYLTLKAEYYTDEAGHHKDLVVDETGTMGGRDIATRMTMVNHHTQTKTEIIINSAEYDVVIDDKYFNPNRFYR